MLKLNNLTLNPNIIAERYLASRVTRAVHTFIQINNGAVFLSRHKWVVSFCLISPTTPCYCRKQQLSTRELENVVCKSRHFDGI